MAELPRNFRMWVGGAWVSQLGDAAMYFALGWAASAHGGAAAGLVLTAVSVPRVLLLLLGGAIADRLGARVVMIVGDAVMFVVASTLAVLAIFLRLPLTVLIATGLIFGTVDAFYLPAAGSMPRRLVGDDQLARAAALRQTGSQLIAVIGGPVGGLLVLIGDLKTAAGIDAVSFAFVLAVLVRVRETRDVVARDARRPIAREALSGLRIAWHTPGLRPLLLIIASSAGFILPVSSLLIPLLARHAGWGPSGAGLIVGAQGIGAAAAAVAVARRGRARRAGVVACSGLLLAAAGELLLAGAGNAALGYAAGLMIGTGTGVFVSHLAPVLLSAAPTDHLSRVQAVFTLAQSCALLCSNAMLGELSRVLGPRETILICVAVSSAAALAGFVSPTVRHITN